MTQLDFNRVVVHGADAFLNNRIQNPSPRRHDRRVAQAFQRENHVRRLDGSSGREGDPRPEMERVGVGLGVHFP